MFMLMKVTFVWLLIHACAEVKNKTFLSEARVWISIHPDHIITLDPKKRLIIIQFYLREVSGKRNKMQLQ